MGSLGITTTGHAIKRQGESVFNYNNKRLTDTSVACSSFTEPDVGREMNLSCHIGEQIAGI